MSPALRAVQEPLRGRVVPDFLIGMKCDLIFGTAVCGAFELDYFKYEMFTNIGLRWFTF